MTAIQRGAALGAISLCVAGCASIQPARMALPEGLNATTQSLPIEGLKGHRSGRFTLGPLAGRFERSASRLDLFDTLGVDRVSARYTLESGPAAPLSAECTGRQRTLALGALQGALRPYEVVCRWSGAGELTLQARSAALGTREERAGRYSAGGVVLDVQSVHRVQGSSLPLVAPIGYTLSQGGRVVGAIEINGSTPQLWRPAAGDALHEPVTRVALALALLWDPAGN